MFTLVGIVGNVALSKFNAFLGMMIALSVSEATSTRRYRTSLWPSVATKVVLVSLRFRNTPVIAGLSSSLLVAKIVLLMASASTSEERLTESPSVTTEILGKSVAFSPANLYLPLSELISIL